MTYFSTIVTPLSTFYNLLCILMKQHYLRTPILFYGLHRLVKKINEANLGPLTFLISIF